MAASSGEFAAFSAFGALLMKAALWIAAAIGPASPVHAAEAIGAAEAVTRRVTGDMAGTPRVLAPADRVHLNEVIRTEAQSATHIRFTDNSDLRLGPSAQIRLDAVVFSGRPNAAMQLTRGALRFVSGNGPSGSYQIRTPVATIGLRGTGVGVVLRQGRAYVTLLSGAARVCSPAGGCSELTNPCDYVVADARGAAPARPLEQGVPTFSAACVGPACGDIVCSPSARGTGRLRPGGYDPAGNNPSGGNSSGATTGGGGGRGKY